MKKLSLLLGSLGGALAGYVFSNKKLRQELSNAKDPQAAAKILGKHLSADGQQVGKELQHFAKAHDLDTKVAEGKKYVMDQYKKSSAEVKKMVDQGVKEAHKLVDEGKKQAKKAVKTAKKKVMGK